MGIFDGNNYPLTRYLYAAANTDHPLTNLIFDPAHRISKKGITGKDECAVINHCLPITIQPVIKHIYQLIDNAKSGNFNAIPRIHWWYVHLAPVKKGPGGIAEMIVTALCEYHGLTLPSWKEGVAPSVEVLLEPNEEKFCANYHALFDRENQRLKVFFATKTAPSTNTQTG